MLPEDNEIDSSIFAIELHQLKMIHSMILEGNYYDREALIG